MSGRSAAEMDDSQELPVSPQQNCVDVQTSGGHMIM